MSHEPKNRPPVQILLTVLRQNVFIGANADVVIKELIGKVPQYTAPEAWGMTIAEALRAGYVYDPVQLEQGSLQCQWRLELTPEGFKASEHMHIARLD
jgi:hypothetical protein